MQEAQTLVLNTIKLGKLLFALFFFLTFFFHFYGVKVFSYCPLISAKNLILIDGASEYFCKFKENFMNRSKNNNTIWTLSFLIKFVIFYVARLPYDSRFPYFRNMFGETWSIISAAFKDRCLKFLFGNPNTFIKNLLLSLDSIKNNSQFLKKPIIKFVNCG